MSLPLKHANSITLVVDSKFPGVITFVEFQTKLTSVFFAGEIVCNGGSGGVWSGLLVEVHGAVITTKFAVFILELNKCSILQ